MRGIPVRITAGPQQPSRVITSRLPVKDRCDCSQLMYKLIVIIVAAVPAILLLRAIFGRRSQKASRAFSDFKKQLDYLVWAILFVIGCVFVYSAASLIHSMWR